MFQKWEEDMWAWCKKYNAEPKKVETGEMTFVCPRKPSEDAAMELGKIVPVNFPEYKFIESLKESTVRKIVGNFSSIGAGVEIRGGYRSAEFLISGDPKMKEHPQIWEDLNKWLESDGFLDRWTILLNDDLISKVNKVLDAEIFKNNQLREKVIGKDDLTNLKILMGSKKELTIDEFLKSI